MAIGKLCVQCGVEYFKTSFISNSSWIKRKYCSNKCKDKAHSFLEKLDFGDFKICSKCGELKPISEYTWQRKDKQKRPNCKSCVAKQTKDRREKDPIHYKEVAMRAVYKYQIKNPLKNKEGYVRRKFNLSLEEFDFILSQLLSIRGATCWVCGRSGKMQGQYKLNDKGRRIVVDHDHETGEIRGLLCDLCNTSLGKLNDDPLLVMKLYDYINKFKGLRYDRHVG